MKILITGATGLIGKELGKLLVAKGHEIVVVSRSKEKALKELPFLCEVIEGDLVKGSINISEPIEGVFHLLGESVAGNRWNEAVKRQILESRVQGTKNLIASLKQEPSFFISASAIGFYGDQPGLELTELSPPDESFLSQVCQAWEESVLQLHQRFSRTLIATVRIGLVLSPKGGALEKMLLPFKLGLGGPLGSGKHIMSWIHIQDLVSIFVYIMEKNLRGVFNGVAPKAVTNKEFSKTLAHTLNRPLGPSVPQWVLKLSFGEIANVLLADQKVSSQKIQNAGFQFQFTDLDQALEDLLIKP